MKTAVPLANPKSARTPSNVQNFCSSIQSILSQLKHSKMNTKIFENLISDPYLLYVFRLDVLHSTNSFRPLATQTRGSCWKISSFEQRSQASITSNSSLFQHLSSEDSFSLRTGCTSWTSSNSSGVWRWPDSRMMIKIDRLSKNDSLWQMVQQANLSSTYPPNARMPRSMRFVVQFSIMSDHRFIMSRVSFTKNKKANFSSDPPLQTTCSVLFSYSYISQVCLQYKILLLHLENQIGLLPPHYIRKWQKMPKYLLHLL